MVERSFGSSFMHSFLAKGRLLYTHDGTIADLCARLQAIGDRDTQVQLLRAAAGAVGSIYKARKWFVTRGDLDYTALWILYSATSLAQIEVLQAKVLVDREVIPQALKLNPAFFKTIYTDLLNTKKTTKAVTAALDAIDGYLAERATTVFGPVLEHLREVREARSCTEIEDHFRRNFDAVGVVAACEYLADRGLIGKASIPVRLTKRSNVDVQELAFFSLDTVDAF
jgi:phage gp36-like protein